MRVQRSFLILVVSFSLFLLISCSKNLPFENKDVLSVNANHAMTVQNLENYTVYEGTLVTGALFKIWLPAEWNGELVLYAHGYVAPTEPVQIPESHLKLNDGTYVPDLVTDMGYAFATTSYRENGFAVQKAIIDLVELEFKFEELLPEPEFVYLVGVSEGGLITAKSLEMKKLYDGGLALCGPVGDMPKQVNYVGDLRVLFDYFFPGILPGSPIHIPDEVMQNWETKYVPKILQALQDYPQRTQELIRCARVPVDPDNPTTIPKSIIGLLWYNVFATNDLVERVGGNPFDNSDRMYHGSGDDQYLNKNVKRFTADPQALENLKRMFNTTGYLNRPIVTMHTVGDPIVPAWHERLYREKVFPENGRIMYTNQFVMRYGHCNFNKEELLQGFALMVEKAKLFKSMQLPGPTVVSRSSWKTISN
ncbi:MAG: hypothetical protein J7L94_02435 [Caldisericaceae bacterium]|nr:hypothetical protein [Caldisericaceae bacterium]